MRTTLRQKQAWQSRPFSKTLNRREEKLWKESAQSILVEDDLSLSFQPMFASY
ncbi:UNVERIFIED_CONTAM: hypothetical protein NY100_06940 [Prevotella sp. 15_C9]